MKKSLWEIYVPRQFNTGRPVRTRYHRLWDAKVMEISGGLSIITPIKGRWRSPDNVVYQEGMIPVQIVATEAEMRDIARITVEHYEQESVMCTLVSPHAFFVDALPQQKEDWKAKNKLGLYK